MKREVGMHSFALIPKEHKDRICVVAAIILLESACPSNPNEWKLKRLNGKEAPFQNYGNYSPLQR